MIHRPQRCSAMALTDSSTLVVFSDRPTRGKTPSRWRVKVSSNPSFRLATADWFTSPSSCLRVFNAWAASLYVGR